MHRLQTTKFFLLSRQLVVEFNASDLLDLFVDFSRCDIVETWREKAIQSTWKNRLREKVFNLEFVSLSNLILVHLEQNFGHACLLGCWALFAFIGWDYSRILSLLLLVLLLLELLELLFGHAFSALLSCSGRLLIKGGNTTSLGCGSFILSICCRRWTSQVLTILPGWRNLLFGEELEIVLDGIIGGLDSTTVHGLNEWLWSQDTVQAVSNDLR